MLSSVRIAYKVGPGLVSRNLNFGNIPTISVSFMLNSCTLSGSLEFWYTPAEAADETRLMKAWVPKV